MYTRTVKECPEKLIQKGKPVFGTFTGYPQKFDIRNIKKPYTTIPFPTFLTNLHIKSKLSFFYNVGKYIGFISFFDAKIFGLAEVIFWDTETKKKYRYRSLLTSRRRFIPHNLHAAGTYSYKKSRYIRIKWNQEIKKISAIFNLRGDFSRPDANAALIADLDNEVFAHLTENNPTTTSRRCSTNYYSTGKLHGAITTIKFCGKENLMNDADGIFFFNMKRSYDNFFSNGNIMTCLSIHKGNYISFRIETNFSSNGSFPRKFINEDQVNPNVLFYNGKTTPLPPVVITHSYGIMENWVIQDTENMVDLTFTPISDNKSKTNAIFLRTEFQIIYGTFDGVLMTCDGEKIPIKGLPGFADKYNVRL